VKGEADHVMLGLRALKKKWIKDPMFLVSVAEQEMTIEVLFLSFQSVELGFT
jgi:hypothetical protein